MKQTYITTKACVQDSLCLYKHWHRSYFCILIWWKSFYNLLKLKYLTVSKPLNNLKISFLFRLPRINCSHIFRKQLVLNSSEIFINIQPQTIAHKYSYILTLIYECICLSYCFLKANSLVISFRSIVTVIKIFRNLKTHFYCFKTYSFGRI